MSGQFDKTPNQESESDEFRKKYSQQRCDMSPKKFRM